MLAAMVSGLLSGVVWTDENGYAHVPLPPYLGRTAPKFRLELYPAAPQVRAQLVTDLPADELTIHTDVPHAKVAWAAVPLHRPGTHSNTKGRQKR
jgi:hypothetical protein